MHPPGEREAQGAGFPATGGQGFRERARVEADRYGPDSWIFIRELLQNARDAGATQVTITSETQGATSILRCRDDGEGMSFEHARSYLFALYASSKESRRDQVGRFGVGFWSILRFEPSRIVIRSQPHNGAAWEIELDGDLEEAVRRSPKLARGTELILERAGSDGAIDRRVWDAARQNARFLSQRDDPSKPLLVTVNGDAINTPFTLPAPSAAFRRAGLRGVVGLGNAARVELFSRGLRVRSAATLDDFLSARGRHTARSRVHFAELPARLAPQAILESERLEVLLSRADARENRALRRLVRLAQRELERLLNHQLDAARPQPWWRRWPQALRLLFHRSLALRTVLAALIGAALALLISVALWGDRLSLHLGRSDIRAVFSGDAAQATTRRPTGGAYSDLAAHYLGPQIDDLQGSGDAVELRYTPANQDLLFTALVIDRFDRDELPSAEPPKDPHPYPGIACDSGDACVHVELRVHLEPGLTRIPVPTGHRLDADSVRLDDTPVAVVTSEHDEALIASDKSIRGVLTYTTGPGTPAKPALLPRRPPALPTSIAREARALRSRPPRERVTRLTELVRERVRYSTDTDVATLLNNRRLAGEALFSRTLAIGRGDCDVQNALLVALLQEAKIPARLAIGYVGRNGHSTAWHHAWAEFRLGTGPWESADASEDSAPPALQGPGSGSGDSNLADSTGHLQGPDPQPTPTGEPAHPATDAAASVGNPQTTNTNTNNNDTNTNDTAALPPSPAPPGSPPVVAVPAPRSSASSLNTPAFAAAGGLALVLLFAVFFVLRRTRRTLALEPSSDLSELLQGVLQHPESFRTLPAVFQRPLIPVAGGAPLSIDKARQMATEGRLFRTRTCEGLAGEAIAAGTRVLDERVAEARTVADALGAIDVDDWGALLEEREASPLLQAINQHLEKIGEKWWVVSAENIHKGPQTLDLSLLGLKRHRLRARQVIVIDSADPWLTDAAEAFALHPRAALFAALDRIAETVDLPTPRRARLLVHGARELIDDLGKAPVEEPR